MLRIVPQTLTQMMHHTARTTPPASLATLSSMLQMPGGYDAFLDRQRLFSFWHETR
jgi:hypothetical protein